MKYQARRFVFRGDCEVGPTDENKDRGVVVQESFPESIVLERVKTFAKEMLGHDEESDKINSHTDSERQEEQPENGPYPAPKNHEELIKKFKSVTVSISADLLQNVLKASMCLEKANKGNIKDVVSNVRKAKSLVRRWLERSKTAGKNDVVNKLHEETLIERDTVVLAEVVVGRGRSSAKVLKQYRVIASTTTSGS